MTKFTKEEAIRILAVYKYAFYLPGDRYLKDLDRAILKKLKAWAEE